VLEHRIAVAKRTLARIQRKHLTGLQIDGVQRIKAVLQLDPVGANVLHRRGAHGAGDQGHVFQPRHALVQGPGDERVPVFPGTGLHNIVLGRLVQQRAAFDFDFEHQRLHIAGQHQVAATAQHELVLPCQLRVGQHRQHIGLAGHANTLPGFGNNVEGVAAL